MKLSTAELTDGILDETTLMQAVREVQLNGYVLFERVLPEAFVNELNASFHGTLNAMLDENPDSTELNTRDMRKNRIRIDLPFSKPFNDPQVIASSYIMPIVEAILGEHCVSTYLAVDAPLPGSDYQDIHSDSGPLFPDAAISLPASSLVLNIPLVDVTEVNGPMEIWANSHLLPENANRRQIHIDTLKDVAPSRMLMPKGSMLLRDPRMLHRGTPNRSDHIRPNVAVIYTKPWMRSGKSLGITPAAYEELPEKVKQLYRFQILN